MFEHAVPRTPGSARTRSENADRLQYPGSDGTLIVSTGAEVTKAVIKVAVARINGTVEGDILASKELVLGRTANVRGHLAAPALIVEEGAQLNGSCRRIDANTADFNIPQKANSNRVGRGSRP